MIADPFVVLAEPTRRRILEELLTGERGVNELVETLGLGQPAVSKHLRVLREAGFVSRRTEAQRRVYRIEVRPLRDVDEWLRPYRALWDRHLDALERHLDSLE
ncbi:ArsR/SmtB family transcription factor [Streptomyces millisiae]|uniref:Metalloregulator ArsR/SmtB family transcription factor n=1 Tax=Streptomyces millisiae TaxID=3075542 RepID=A0ABU2LMA0_9ACTN|nr:metalloregulator ArsR/SmtB family transcription factor [Streptomyces sp. DSM 44918]MDT0318715.1 metalloregulator ArsR/SmtB family transcription factor [Streptomyces sp. DSM 44918]